MGGVAGGGHLREAVHCRSLGFAGRDFEGEPVLPCELLVHMIEESALHNAHAGPLRQRIGR